MRSAWLLSSLLPSLVLLAGLGAQEGTLVVPHGPDRVVDGSLGDWSGPALSLLAFAENTVPALPEPVFSATASLVFTPVGLVLAVHLESDQPLVEAGPDQPLYSADSLELFLRSSTATVQVVLAPGMAPEQDRLRQNVFDNRGTDPAWKSLPVVCTAARVRTASGCVIEAVLPLDQLRLAPSDAVEFALKANKSVRGQGRRQLATAGANGDAFIRLQASATAPGTTITSVGWLAREPTSTQIGVGLRTVGSSAWSLRQGDAVLCAGTCSATASAWVSCPAPGTPALTLWLDGVQVARLAVPDVTLELRRDLESAAFVPMWWMRDRDAQSIARLERLRPQLNALLTGPELPQACMGDVLLARQAGITGVETRWFGADGRPAVRADRPGRYGAVIDVRCSDGSTVTFHQTCVLLPSGVLPGEALAAAMRILGGTARPDRSANAELVNLERRALAWLGAQREAAVLLAALTEAAVDGTPPRPPARDQAWWHVLRTTLGTATVYPYHKLLPAGYDPAAATRWPAVIYLHGSGGALPRDYGPLAKRLDPVNAERDLIGWAKQHPQPFAIYALLASAAWEPPAVAAALERILAEDRIDPDRVVVMGFSMGAIGTWNCALDLPGRFAAAVPIGGRGYRSGDVADLVGKLPVWIFNGDADQATTLASALPVFEALRTAGGEVRLTVLPGIGHGGSQNATFNTPGLWEWLAAQRRR